MKLAIILSTILLAGCQTTPQQKELLRGLAQGMQNAADSYNQSMQNYYHNYNQAQMYNRNITCRSYRAGNSIRTNCW